KTQRVTMAWPTAKRMANLLPQGLLARIPDIGRAKKPALVAVVLLAGVVTRPPTAAEPDAPALDRRFNEVAQPFLKNYCLGCHGVKKHEAKLDLSGYTSTTAVVKGERIWEHVLERLEAEEMPPAKAPRQPTPHERRAVLDWVREVREREARR